MARKTKEKAPVKDEDPISPDIYKVVSEDDIVRQTIAPWGRRIRETPANNCIRKLMAAPKLAASFRDASFREQLLRAARLAGITLQFSTLSNGMMAARIAPEFQPEPRMRDHFNIREAIALICDTKPRTFTELVEALRGEGFDVGSALWESHLQIMCTDAIVRLDEGLYATNPDHSEVVVVREKLRRCRAV